MMNLFNSAATLGVSLDLNSVQMVSLLLMAIIVLVLLQTVVFAALLSRVAKKSKQTAVEERKESAVEPKQSEANLQAAPAQSSEEIKTIECAVKDIKTAVVNIKEAVEDIKVAVVESAAADSSIDDVKDNVGEIKSLIEDIKVAAEESVAAEEAIEDVKVTVEEIKDLLEGIKNSVESPVYVRERQPEQEAAAAVAEQLYEDEEAEEETEEEQFEEEIYEIEEDEPEDDEEEDVEGEDDEDIEDEEEDDDDEEDQADVALSGEKNLRPRVIYSTKLRLSSDKIKGFYTDIKNEFFSYGVKSRISKTKENFNFSRDNIARLVMRGKTLKLYIALDPTELDNKYFHHKDMSAKKTYAHIPTVIPIKSALAVTKTKMLIEMLAEKLALKKKPRYKTKDFSEELSPQGLTYTDKKGYGHLVRASVELQDVNEYPDELATLLTQVAKVDSNTTRFVKTAVTVGDLAKMFDDGSMVSIEKVKALGVGSKNANWLTVEADGVLDKKLRVYARELAADAVKMIVLAGGEAYRIENK